MIGGTNGASRFDIDKFRGIGVVRYGENRK